ncbi:MAG: alpha/beta hydrolase [Chloroflexi bacterium]|nr:alpha/beta hydrolase [Chloroflexota bacterium]
MSSWTNGTVLANQIELFYTRTGGDKPPLLLLHGLTDNGLCWQRAAEVWEADFDVMMVDARGHGRSTAPASDKAYTTQLMVDDLLGFMTAMGIEKTGIVGHSMGAAVAAQFAVSHPDKVKWLVLEEPPWGVMRIDLSEEDRFDMAEDWRDNILSQKEMSIPELIMTNKGYRMEENVPPWDDIDYPAWAESNKQVSPHVVNLVLEGWPDWRTFVAEINCPTLILGGDPDLGALATPETLAEIVAMNGTIQAARFAGAGHSIRREQFSEYIDIINRFAAQQ